MNRIFSADRIIASLLIASLVGIVLGLAITRGPRRDLRRFNETHTERTERHQRQNAVGTAAIGVSVVTGLAALALGLGIAFGFLPSWLGKNLVVTIEERIALFPEGDVVLNQGAQEGARHYLRVRLEDDSVAEYSCSPEQYRRCALGEAAYVRVAGSRIVSLAGTPRK